jgi:hypothetical protein
MNETSSAVDAVPFRRPPPSTYLWTADGWIRGIRRPTDAGPAASGSEDGLKNQ